MRGRVFRALAEGRQQLVMVAEELDRDRLPPARWRRCSTTWPCDRPRGRRSWRARRPLRPRPGRAGRPARGRRRVPRSTRGARRGWACAQAVPDRARRPRMAATAASAGQSGPAARRVAQGPLPFRGIGGGAAQPGHAIPGRGEEEGGGGDRPRGRARRATGRASGGGTVTGGVYRPAPCGPPERAACYDSPAYVRPPGAPSVPPPSAGRVRRGKLAHRSRAEPVPGRGRSP